MRGQLKYAALLAAVLLLASCLPTTHSEPLSPTGGYAETEITPSEPLNGDLFALFPHPDGSVDYFAEAVGPRKRRFTHYYSPDGGVTWEKQDLGWLKKAVRLCGYPEKTAGLSILYMLDMDDSRTIYFVARDAGERFRLFQASPNGEVTDVPIPEWRSESVTAAFESVESLHVDPEGNVGVGYVRSSLPSVIYTGQDRAVKVTAWLQWQSVRATLFTPDEMILLGEDGDLHFHDAATGDERRRLTPAHRDEYMVVTADSEGAVYTASRSGIDRLPAHGAIFETVLDGGDTAFAASDIQLRELRREPVTDSFYLLVYDEKAEKNRLFRYVYDPGLPL